MAITKPGAIALAWIVVAGACGGSPAAPTPPNGGTTGGGPAGTAIGPSGGTVTSPDGSATLVVPANALTATVQLSVAPVSSRPLDPAAVSGTGVQVEPASTQFAVPATLTLSYTDDKVLSGASASGLKAFTLEGGAWASAVDSTVDTGAARVAARITRGGGYGLRIPNPTAACADPVHRQFDFWLGAWNYIVNGNQGGTNDITVDGTGCWIMENYVAPNGNRGRSISFYDTATGRWHQTYVDSMGTRLVLVGSLDGQRMALVNAANGNVRFIWDPTSAPNRVLYFPETINGQTWSGTASAWYQRR